MITICGVPFPVPDHCSDARMAGIALRQPDCIDHRVAGAAPRGRGTAPPGRPTALHLAGPGRPVRPRQDAAALTEKTSARHSSHVADLAPASGSEEVDPSAPDRAPTDQRGDPIPGS